MILRWALGGIRRQWHRPTSRCPGAASSRYRPKLAYALPCPQGTASWPQGGRRDAIPPVLDPVPGLALVPAISEMSARPARACLVGRAVPLRCSAIDENSGLGLGGVSGHPDPDVIGPPRPDVMSMCTLVGHASAHLAPLTARAWPHGVWSRQHLNLRPSDFQRPLSAGADHIGGRACRRGADTPIRGYLHYNR
jgi:hypothetical protein